MRSLLSLHTNKMNEGFITLHRKLTEWEWYDDIPTCRLFLHLLLTVNWKDKKWRGVEIKRGQILTGVPTLSEQTNLSPMQVRRALDNLIKTGEVNRQTTSQYSLITLNKYNHYQARNSQTTDEQQTDNIQATDEQQQLNKDNKANKDKELLAQFEKFWSEYPKKKDKRKAQDKFCKLSLVDIENIFTALSWQVKLDDWTKDGGKFIPYPTTYLNGERWKDEPEQVKTKSSVTQW